MSPTLERHVVTAVLVAHDGARWLPATLKALLTQSRPVQRLVAVDCGSDDRGPAVLADVVGEGNLLRLPRRTGFGEAVAAALRHPAASVPIDETPDTSTVDNGAGAGAAGGAAVVDTVEWVWLIHDDCAPAPDALDRLLAVAETDRGVAVLGPKLRDWQSRRTLLEIG